MSLAASRRWALVAAPLLLLPVLATMLALPAAPHAGHDCPFEKECLACRWAADAVTEVAAPVAQPGPPQPSGFALEVARPLAREASRRRAFSRGPPQY
jgi:hypothetical protein